MHERMETHFRPRIGLGDPKLPVLVQSQSAEVVELMSAVSSPAAPFLNWFFRTIRQPAYRVSGSIGSTNREVHVLAKLEHMGTTVGHWNKTFPVRDWFAGQQDLAYEVLLH
jgi:hypothetical protein